MRWARRAPLPRQPLAPPSPRARLRARLRSSHHHTRKRTPLHCFAVASILMFPVSASSRAFQGELRSARVALEARKRDAAQAAQAKEQLSRDFREAQEHAKTVTAQQQADLDRLAEGLERAERQPLGTAKEDAVETAMKGRPTCLISTFGRLVGVARGGLGIAELAVFACSRLVAVFIAPFRSPRQSVPRLASAVCEPSRTTSGLACSRYRRMAMPRTCPRRAAGFVCPRVPPSFTNRCVPFCPPRSARTPGGCRAVWMPLSRSYGSASQLRSNSTRKP